MSEGYKKAYEMIYRNNRLGDEQAIYTILRTLSLDNHFISNEIKYLHNAMLLNNEHDIRFHLGIITEGFRDSMYMAFAIKDFLNKHKESQTAETLNEIDNIVLGYGTLLALAYELERFINKKDTDNMDYALALIYNIHDYVSKRVERLKSIF